MHKDRGISQRSEFEGNGERVVETFIDLVTIDSPTGSEQAISDYLVNHFSKRGIEVVQDTKRNVLAKIPGVGEPLLFAAHMDTVEPGTTIRPQIVDGVLKSSSDTILGADNKSTIAVLLETVDRLREGHDVHRPLELLFTVDEEQGNTGAA